MQNQVEKKIAYAKFLVIKGQFNLKSQNIIVRNKAFIFAQQHMIHRAHNMHIMFNIINVSVYKMHNK